MIPGIEVNLGGTPYTIPPLTIGQLTNGGLALLQEHDQLVEARKIWESYTSCTKLIAMAMRRNSPDMTEAQIYDLIDMRNINDAFLAVIGATGLTMGEMQAGAATGISPQSTLPSPAPMDGQRA